MVVGGDVVEKLLDISEYTHDGSRGPTDIPVPLCIERRNKKEQGESGGRNKKSNVAQ